MRRPQHLSKDMNRKEKQDLLREVETHIQEVAARASDKIPVVAAELELAQKSFRTARDPDSKAVAFQLMHFAQQNLAALQNAGESPYFARCDAEWNDTRETGKVFIGKYGLLEEHIYSWVSPIARLRFEHPGPVRITGGRGQTRSGRLARVDQLLVTAQKILFFVTEREGQARELVYQENFSNRKTAFILPEIVERMERAQDDVIRAEARGPLLIAGPAGSGKTTLALHRVAYLTQSPQTRELFPSLTIMVLVQDTSTKAYFSELLPSLGIRDVLIQTFPEWAMEVLKLGNYKFISRSGENEAERDLIEHLKHRALRAGFVPQESPTPEIVLREIYKPYFPSGLLEKVLTEIRAYKLDRFDLTVLLQDKIHREEKLVREEKVYSATQKGRARAKWVRQPIAYSLLVLDEAENYLPEQIAILRTCVNPETQAVVYVGDLAQQTSLGTLRSWTEAGEELPDGRKITLGKVYRSTHEIVSYIQDLGYAVEVPKGLRVGREVEEQLVTTLAEALRYARELAEKNPEVLTGILALTPEAILPYRKLAEQFSNVRTLTISEAQGVEFEVVCLVGLTQGTLLLDELVYEQNLELKAEKQKVLRDLIYVGLTRAMNELHVLSSVSLTEILCTSHTGSRGV